MQWLLIILGAIVTVWGVYFGLIAIWGSLRPNRPIPSARPEKRIAAIIPARNESAVIKGLIASIDAQNYPAELREAIVVLNNCTDDTSEIAQRAGARIVDCKIPVRSKGEALKFAFNKLLADENCPDAFVILDADNVLDPGFFQAVNDALASGYNVGQSFRDSKNPSASWISSCYSIFFWFMNRLYNRPRAALGMSASLNGTGIMVSADLLRRIGYNVSTLTEDLEFCAQCALADEKIAWIENAITFDEQPTGFYSSFVQRRRWGAGSKQCMIKYWRALAKRAPHSKVCLDNAIFFSGLIIQFFGVVSVLLTACMLIGGILQSPRAGIVNALLALGFALVSMFVSGMAYSLLICLLEKRLKGRRLLPVCTMGVFLFTWALANLLALFTPPPVWKCIPHGGVSGSEALVAACENESESLSDEGSESTQA